MVEKWERQGYQPRARGRNAEEENEPRLPLVSIESRGRRLVLSHGSRDS